MPEQWEYRTETTEVGPYYDAMLELNLIPLGRLGWELILLVQFPTEDTSRVLLKAYLKRRVASEG